MTRKKSSNQKCLNCQSSGNIKPKYQFGNFQLFTCQNCTNGFVNPLPKDIGKLYPENYWKMSGPIGKIKNLIYDFFQTRRNRALQSYLKKGSIVDVGAGEARFAKNLNGFQITSIDFPGSKIKNPDVLKVDFLKWNTKQKFDAIVFWQSLEHIPNSQKYLQKSNQLLKKGGLIFIECPRYDSLESNLFGKNWYHLDPPRHLLHFSKSGINRILKKQFQPLFVKNVFAPEYMLPGLVVSLANSMGFKPVDSYLKRKNLLPNLILLTILMPIAIAIESVLYLSNQSPIMLAVARKQK